MLSMASQKMADKMIGYMCQPTGIGMKYGGDAGFCLGVKLISSCVEKLIVNPNAVNCSSINEMTSNCLYVEGSTIDRVLEGKIGLKQRKIGYNKILCLVNKPLNQISINAAHAFEHTVGGEVFFMELDTPLTMLASINPDGSAGAYLTGVEEAIEQVKKLDILPDQIMIHTFIDCPKAISDAYWKGDIKINPWGRTESDLSKKMSQALNIMCVHAPMEFLEEPAYDKIVRRSQAPEAIDLTYSFCCYKGLNKAPQICEVYERGAILSSDISVLITPHGCWGRPHIAATKLGIPVVVVKDNTTIYSRTWNNEQYPKNVILVENYLEAAGILMSLQAGIDYRLIKDGEIG